MRESYPSAKDGPAQPELPSFAAAGTPARAFAGFCLRHSRPLTILVALLLVFLRRPDSLLTPQFFWEDGVVFFKDCLLDGLSLGNTYAGYIHLLPRLAAKVFMAFPYAWQPLLYNLTSYGCTAFVLACIMSPRLELPVKPLLALAVVLVPHDSVVYANLTHVQFLLSLLLPVLTLYKTPQNWGESLFDIATLLLVGLTGPFTIFFFPFIGYRLIAGGVNRHNLLFLAAFCIPLAIQGFYLGRLALFYAESLGPHRDPSVWFDALARGASGAFLLFKKSKIAGIVLSLLFYLFIAYAALSLPGTKQRRGILICLGYGVLIIVAGYYKYRDEPISMLRMHERYLFAIRVFFFWTLALAAAKHRPPLKQIAVFCLVLFAGLGLYHSVFAHPRTLRDNNWRYHSTKIDTGLPAFLPIAPDNMGGIILPQRQSGSATVSFATLPGEGWKIQACWRPDAVLPRSPDPTRGYFFGTRAGGCTGAMQSKPFRVDRPMLLEIPFIRGPNHPEDLRLGVRSLTDQNRVLLCDLKSPGAQFWFYCALDLTPLLGHDVLVFAEDNNPALECWLGFGQPWLYTSGQH